MSSTGGGAVGVGGSRANTAAANRSLTRRPSAGERPSRPARRSSGCWSYVQRTVERSRRTRARSASAARMRTTRVDGTRSSDTAAWISPRSTGPPISDIRRNTASSTSSRSARVPRMAPSTSSAGRPSSSSRSDARRSARSASEISLAWAAASSMASGMPPTARHTALIAACVASSASSWVPAREA